MSMPKDLPPTIENRWDILYRDFPDVYDAFAAVPKDPDTFAVLRQHFDFQGKRILDVGSGTGSSTLTVARWAEAVIGLEIEDAMRALALRQTVAAGILNASFVPGSALDIPFKDNYFDLVLAVTLPIFRPEEIRRFAAESLRVTKQGGFVVNVGIAPFWYGGDLAAVILGEERVTEVDTEGVFHRVLADELHFDFFDYEAQQEYGSLDAILSTYGFIFGRKAMDYLTEHRQTAIRWTFRVHYCRKA